jgi:hypothetical protein
MKRIFFFIYIALSFCPYGFSQGELNEQKKIFYRNEKSLAFLLNSNGIGLNGRYSKRIDAFQKTNYDVEIVTLKHPKEYRKSSDFNPSAQGFVLGKLNTVVVIRGGYGKQKEIYQKFDVGGISIRRFYAFGPSLALLKPIYYEVYNQNTQEILVEKFDPASADNIVGKGSFFKGFNEVKVRPGVFAKVGISFEYSKFDKVIHALEGGAILEGFPTELPIMATKQNYQFFLTLFISYRFGKVIDTFKPNQESTKSEDYNF